MSELLKRKKVKVRKNHTCQGCGIVIKSGEMANVDTCTGDDGIYTIYTCDVCEKWIKEKCYECDEFSDCIGENFRVGDILECMTQEV